MKKVILIVVAIVLFLILLEQTILKDKGVVEETAETYEKIENPETLQIGLEPEKLAPLFTLQTLEGDTVSLEDYRGQKIMLNFWATWCPPCKEEMPDMQEIYEEKQQEEIAILAINVTPSEKNPKLVNSFVEEYGLTFPILMDEQGAVTYQYEILSYPTSYFIDTDGVVRKKVIGGLTKERILQELSLLP